LQPEQSRLDGGGRDRHNLEGGGRPATVHPWQGRPHERCLGAVVAGHPGEHQQWEDALGWLSAVVSRTRLSEDGTGRPLIATAVVTPIPPPPNFVHPPHP